MGDKLEYVQNDLTTIYVYEYIIYPCKSLEIHNKIVMENAIKCTEAKSEEKKKRGLGE